MNKELFTKNKFTNFLDDAGYDLSVPFELKKHCELNINPEDFFQFMEINWMDSYCLPYEPRAILDPTSNIQAEFANQLGYHSGNTLKRDWGKNNPAHDGVLKEIIGNDNFAKMGIDPATTLVRLLCYQPGNIFPLHWDGFEGWQQKFKIDKMPTRYSVLVNPWSWGQYLQIHDNMITNWVPGDTYIIPKDVLHCSGNGGILPKVTLTITGLPE